MSRCAGGRPRVARPPLGILLALVAASCTAGGGGRSPVGFVTTPPPRPSASAPVTRADGDFTIELFDAGVLLQLEARALLTGGLGVSDVPPSALAASYPTPGNPANMVHLSRGELVTIERAGAVRILTPRTGAERRSVRVTPELLGVRADIVNLELEDVAVGRGGAAIYVGGRFANPGDRDGTGFLLTFDRQLALRHRLVFDRAPIQRIAGDRRGGLAILIDGEVVDAERGSVLKEGYERAKLGTAVHRDDRGRLWITVGDDTEDPFLLGPHGRVALPRRAIPTDFIPVRDGFFIVTRGVTALSHVTYDGTLRSVPLSCHPTVGVAVGTDAFVLCAGESMLVAVHGRDFRARGFRLTGMPTLIG